MFPYCSQTFIDTSFITKRMASGLNFNTTHLSRMANPFPHVLDKNFFTLLDRLLDINPVTRITTEAARQLFEFKHRRGYQWPGICGPVCDSSLSRAWPPWSSSLPAYICLTIITDHCNETNSNHPTDQMSTSGPLRQLLQSVPASVPKRHHRVG